MHPTSPPMPSMQSLQVAIQRGFNLAFAAAIAELRELNLSCQRHLVGLPHDVPAVLRLAHLTAGSLLSVGEMGAENDFLSEQDAGNLLEMGEGIQRLAFEHEKQHLAGALSPTDLHYDLVANLAELEALLVKTQDKDSSSTSDQRSGDAPPKGGQNG